MPNASLFEPLPWRAAPTVEILFEDRPLQAPADASVAAALLAAGVTSCRTSPVGGGPRGPFCLMGQCFECLVEIDGMPNQQGCMTRVRPGMRIRRMRELPGDLA